MFINFRYFQFIFQLCSWRKVICSEVGFLLNLQLIMISFILVGNEVFIFHTTINNVNRAYLFRLISSYCLGSHLRLQFSFGDRNCKKLTIVVHNYKSQSWLMAQQFRAIDTRGSNYVSMSAFFCLNFFLEKIKLRCFKQ